MFKRISKRDSKKLFAQGKTFYLCPCKMRPDGPFSMAIPIHPREYIEHAERYRDHSTLWKGSTAETAWQILYRNWSYYNASYETGYYPHYYAWEEPRVCNDALVRLAKAKALAARAERVGLVRGTPEGIISDREMDMGLSE